ncbi:MAG: hypothetical protein ACRYG4_04040 [Janthinobacterium lividum]
MKMNHDLFDKNPPAPAKGRAKGRKAPPASTSPEPAPLAPAPAPGRALAVIEQPAPEPGRALATVPAIWPPATYAAPWGRAEIPATHLLPSARSLAAYKAAANRDCFAAGRKAADTRAARKLLTAGPPSFVDYVSDRIGTRRWIVGPVKPRDRERVAKLADKIVTPTWYDALRAAYLAAHAG